MTLYHLYVPNEELNDPNFITASWAGGEDGRVIIDQFLPLLDTYLSSSGRCYLVLVQENRPREIAQFLRTNYKLHSEVCVSVLSVVVRHIVWRQDGAGAAGDERRSGNPVHSQTHSDSMICSQ